MSHQEPGPHSASLTDGAQDAQDAEGLQGAERGPAAGEADEPGVPEKGTAASVTAPSASTAPPAPTAGGRPARPRRMLYEHSPFRVGLGAGIGALTAVALAMLLRQIESVLLLVVISLFIAVGLNPMVERLMRRRVPRSLAVLVVTGGVVVAVALFLVAIVPIIGDQVDTIRQNVPGWIDQLQHNRSIQHLDHKYDILNKVKDYFTGGDLAKRLAGGALGVGLAVLSFLGNAFVVIVLTLYFLATLPGITRGFYRLAPASSRGRVTEIGDQVLRNIGGYVSGAFIVATCAGLSTLIFLFIVGLGQYAVALALVVAILDVIPMIGASIGAVIVCAIALASDPTAGIAAIIFYIAYQQVENYLIYPRVMSRSVDIPGSLTVIAALVGASLLGVVGALLAIPVAASILLIINQLFLPRQEQR